MVYSTRINRYTIYIFFSFPTDPVLQFLLAGLQEAQLATVAANALRKVCEQCSLQMTEHFAGLLHIVQAMDSFNVSHEASLGLLRGED